MAVRVAINGFGRIGRLAFRQMFDAEGYEVVAINDLTSPKMLAHLLKYDTAQGSFCGKIGEAKHTVEATEDSIIVDGKEIKIYAVKDAKDAPWGELNVDVVLECTGFYTSKEKSMAHIQAGAKKVVISAPAGNDLKTIVYSVNEKTLTAEDQVISAASCTTNCLAPMATTMLRMINGLQKPDSGKVYAAGEDVGEADLIRLRRKIGYVIQNKGLFPHMTVEKNIIYVPVISGQKDKRQNRKLAEELIGLVGLEREMLDRYPEELSGGQQQRVGIARALASRPKLLLMDEPFGALDEITKRAMQNELLALQKKLGMTVVFITHDIREAMKLGDRVLVMEQGKIAQCDTPENVKKNPADEFVKELIG